MRVDDQGETRRVGELEGPPVTAIQTVATGADGAVVVAGAVGRRLKHGAEQTHFFVLSLRE